MAYVVKKEHKNTVVSRMVVGFGQHEFKVGEMTSEEVTKWKKREGGDVTEYFDEVKDVAAHKAADKEADAKKAEYVRKVTVLKEMGFSRVQNDFTRGEQVVSAQTVLDSSEKGFEEIVAGFETPAPAKEEAPVIAPAAPTTEKVAAAPAPAASATKSTGTKSTGTKSTGTKSTGTKKS